MSALIVEMPDAEPVVQDHRRRWDSSAALGVPAHVTVLGPFMPPSQMDVSVREELASIFGNVKRFDVTFARSDWFGDSVLWLAPEPAAIIRNLTSAVVEAFPQYPPYEGEFDEVIIPHLTIADHGDPQTLRGIETSITQELPVQSSPQEVSLYCGTDEPGSWFRAAAFPLG